MELTGNIIVDTICRTAELGLTITDAADAGDITYIHAHPITVDPACPDCRENGRLRDHVTRTLVDLPAFGFPVRLRVRVPRFTSATNTCQRRIYQTPLACAQAGSSVTRRVTRWVLQRLALDRMSVQATAKVLGVGWDLVNSIALDACRSLIYDQPGHFDQVRVLGVDEHVWKHTTRPGQPSKFVTIFVDLTPVIEGTGPSRLLDVVPGRSGVVVEQWLAQRTEQFRSMVTTVAMDGFAGYATAVGKQIPTAQKVMDPFHVVHLAAEKLTTCRQRLQRETSGRRGRTGDPLYKNRKTLLTRIDFLTDRQAQRLEELWDTDDDYVVLEVTWIVYQMMIDAYADKDRRVGKRRMWQLLASVRHGVPEGLEEVASMGRSLWRRRHDIVAYFDRGVSNGPVEAINGRLEHLRGIALGFRNLDHYILRCLIHSGQLQGRINAL
ncbi:Transposase [Corynebacterium atrinae]|uniref:ISL3 family transposase n=1 Tax=Corynebacterium atrinae TaxID=1336740 RepID=UPI0025B42630|nr:ISL3 family transposase [Corynebacterium atrinae]WJY62998.1 Transposase [Corynebacterium atrinae]